MSQYDKKTGQQKVNQVHEHDVHRAQPSQKPYLIGISLNLIFVLSELLFSKIAHSTALFADAFHNLSDVLALVIAWLAVLVFGIKATRNKTYGFHNVSILASIFNTVLLLFAVGTIFIEGFNNLMNPEHIQTNGLMITVVAAVGIVVNVSTALLFKASGVPDAHEHGHEQGPKQDLNAKTAYIHLLSDAGVSIGVILAGWLIKVTGWQLIDPIVSLLIGLIILISAWPVMKETVNLAINGVPDEIDAVAVFDYLLNKPGVENLHDLHIWPLSTTETALTVHLSLTEEQLDDQHGIRLLNEIENELKTDFGISHVTIQIEGGQTEENCNVI
ncbi:cation diffusion facilitator family transporter [Fructobacillus sp. M1-13]|uniref:Cation transporter n=1 Tax=Fructobacillus papyriferae TaxID=2713171 RepID=A0ABS5QPY2_9LACO|nr:cation diffusion facilitator family transporter [Fructobacillus papyriferae]MBS9335239.1 cation transporter [Fructobacillus papyriferae]MCD2159092.1 cation diffusion facilitator family transporter [Fructobacillus papyriferae]